MVLLDIGMPGMDGLEVAHRIRALPGGRDVLLVALTGWGQDEDRRRTAEAGFDEHLTKPVDTERLAALLENDANDGKAAERGIELGQAARAFGRSDAVETKRH